MINNKTRIITDRLRKIIELSQKRAHLDKSSLLQVPPTVQWVGPVGFHLSLLGSRIHHGLYWVAFIYLKLHFAWNKKNLKMSYSLKGFGPYLAHLICKLSISFSFRKYVLIFETSFSHQLKLKPRP